MSVTDWVPPESPTPRAATTPPGSPALSGAPRRPEVPGEIRDQPAAPDAADRLLPRPVPLRPLTVADVFDGAFNVIKARPLTMLAICATFVIPLVVLQILLTPEGFTTGVIEAAVADVETQNDDLGYYYLYLLLDSMILPFVGAGIAHVVAAWYAGAELSAGTAVWRVVKRAHVLLVAWAASHVLIGLGFALFLVGSLVFMAMYMALAPAVAIEGRGPFASMGRSQKLCSKRLMWVLWIAVLAGVISTTIGSALPLLAETIVALVGERFDWLWYGTAAVVTRLLVTPVVAASAVIVYLDLRVRYEGLDLELALLDHGRAS